MANVTGKISQVIGPVIDVSFDKGVSLPNIYDALVVTKADGSKVVLEVQSHVGENAVRAIRDNRARSRESFRVRTVTNDSCPP